jgi:hypothetical protein
MAYEQASMRLAPSFHVTIRINSFLSRWNSRAPDQMHLSPVT